jgi:hypothetical protein
LDGYSIHPNCYYHWTAVLQVAEPETALHDPTLFDRTLIDAGCLLAKRMTKPAKPKVIKIFFKCAKGMEPLTVLANWLGQSAILGASVQ